MYSKVVQSWRKDKLYTIMVGLWIVTVVSSFFGPYFMRITFPLVGSLYAFRIFLPLTATLYIAWAVKSKEPLWRNSTDLERWCYIFIAILLGYGAVSLFRAIDAVWTFRRFFNLCFDLCFFFLMLRLCKNRLIWRMTIRSCLVMLVVIATLGIYEIFFGGIVNQGYDDFKRFLLFQGVYQFPVVFTSNTNDYASTLIFIFTSLLLVLIRSNDEKNSKIINLWVVIMGIAVYFLVLAGSARLCIVATGILYIGILLYYFVREKRRLAIPICLLVGILGVEFASNYRYIVPPMQQYFTELKEYHAQQGESSDIWSDSSEPSAERPELNLGNPNKQPLEEEFFSEDEKTGEKVLNEGASGGVRVRLLLHALDCFKESYGLGVGLGNTETLAAERNLIEQWKGNTQLSIHCFIARLIADYGIFALIPLCAIAFLLLKRWLEMLVCSVRMRDRDAIAYALLFLTALLIYPVVSTASSDAQDNISMWIYLGVVVFIYICCSKKNISLKMG